MVYYLLEFVFYLFILFGVYQFGLKRLKFFHLNRAFLLSILPLSMWMSTWEVEAYTLNKLNLFSKSADSLIEPLSILASEVIVSDKFAELHLLKVGITTLYLLGVLFLGLRFIWSLGKLFSLYKSAEKVQMNGRSYLLTESAEPAFSFFHWVFLHPRFSEPDLRQQYIVRHEEVHSKQLHSVDLIYAQLLKVLFWFHPCVYWVFNEVRMNHEFLADRDVCRTCKPGDYFRFLLSFRPMVPNLITNPFAAYAIKNRLRAAESPSRLQIKYILTFILVIPLLGLAKSVFSAGEYMSDYTTRDYIERKNELHIHIHASHNYGIISVDQNEYGSIVKLEE